jgi:hypothetical protein
VRYKKVQEGPEMIVKGNGPCGPSPYRIMPQPRVVAAPAEALEVSAPVLHEEVVPIVQVERKPEALQGEPQLMPRHSVVESSPHWDRRTFNDLTAHPAFAHDQGYHWLIGVVQQRKDSRTWEIRYASAEEDDIYGGHLQLVPAGAVPDLQNGLLVRVEGHVHESSGRPTFQAQSIRAILSQP